MYSFHGKYANRVDDSKQIDNLIDQWRQQRPEVDVGPMATFGKLRRLSTRLWDKLAEGYALFDLGEGEFDVLSSLRRMGDPFELPPGQLAQHTMVTPGATSKRIDRLVEAGLVTRRDGTYDRRTRVIALTDEGRRRIDAAFDRHAANERRLAAALTAEEVATLDALLSKWLDALPDMSPHPAGRRSRHPTNDPELD